MAYNSKTDRRNNVEQIVLRGILSIMIGKNVNIWTGTMTNLMTNLNRVLSKHQRTLIPATPSALRMVVNRVTNRLRSRKISVRFGRTPDHSRTRFVRFAQ
jgi:hypothetical protein